MEDVISCQFCKDVMDDMDELQLHQTTSCRSIEANDSQPIPPIDPTLTRSNFAIEAEKFIARFCVEAPSTDVRNCLRLYTADKTYSKLKASFNSCSKSVILETLRSLGVDKDNWDDHLKSSCVHELILRIQNLLPEVCNICKETYTISKNDPPLLSCSVCNQEVHRKCYLSLFMEDDNVDDEYFKAKILSIPGFHYLCPSCEEETIPNKKGGLKKSKKNENCDSNTVESNASLFSSQPKELTNSPLLSNNMNTIASYSHSTKHPPLNPDVFIITNENDKSSGNKSNKQSSGDKQHTPDAKASERLNTQICHHYKNNICKHGMKGKDCPFLHPKRCMKLMNYGTNSKKGCNLGKKCTDFHPKMCPMSISKSECFNDRCNLCHVKGTKRKKSKEKDVRHDAKKSNKISASSSSTNLLPSEVSRSADLKIIQQSFLEQISLLKKELQEAVDLKISCLLQMPNVYQQRTYQMLPPMSLPQHQPYLSSQQWQPPHYQAPIPQVHHHPLSNVN
jgi:hypothetical protein